MLRGDASSVMEKRRGEERRAERRIEEKRREEKRKEKTLINRCNNIALIKLLNFLMTSMEKFHTVQTTKCVTDRPHPPQHTYTVTHRNTHLIGLPWQQSLFFSCSL